MPGMKERGRGRGRGPPRGRGFFPRGRGRGGFYGGFDPSYGYGGYGGGYGYAVLLSCLALLEVVPPQEMTNCMQTIRSHFRVLIKSVDTYMIQARRAGSNHVVQIAFRSVKHDCPL